MVWQRVSAILILIAGIAVGYFVYHSQLSPGRFAFKLGLDLSGGSHLVYKADTKKVASGDIGPSMEVLRTVIESRVNAFGVSEPLVQVERASALSGVSENRLIVELPGVTDVNAAIFAIGKTPLLEFKLMKPDAKIPEPGSSEAKTFDVNSAFTDTGLTGRLFSRATLNFGTGQGGANINQPIVSIEFNAEGSALFEKITREHVGGVLGIFLDGVPISTPVIREAITGGKATISGNFTPTEARDLVQSLNFGALPVPISLIGTQTIGASLGEAAAAKSVYAGELGFLAVALFMLLWYRLPGLISILALGMYVVMMLALFKIIPVTLTAAGIAGFILSVGMAVDANILIFERMKEELNRGHKLGEAIREGFARAWPSIRDSNISSIITAFILYWLGGTAVIKGFALVFGVGVLVSMFTAVSISRTFLYALGLLHRENKGAVRALFGNGFKF